MKVFELFGKISINSKQAIAQMGLISTAGKKMRTKLAGIFTAIGKAAKVAFLAVGIAAGAIFVKAIKEAAAFEQAMAGVKGVTGATEQEFADLTAKAKELGRETKFTMTEIAAGMEALGRAGFTTTEIIGAMEGVTALASAEMISLAQASEITANIMRQMGLDVEETDRAVNVLSQTAATSNTTVSSLAESFKFLGPTARAMGMSLEETAAIIGKLGDAGLKGGIATRSLQTALLGLADPTDDAADLMEELNIAFFDAQGNFIGMSGLIAELEQGFVGLTQQQKLAAMETLFGSGAVKQMNNLLAVGSEEIANYTESLTGTNKAFDLMWEKLDTLEGQWTILKGSISLVLQTLGESMMPILKNLLKDRIIPLVNGIQQWAEETGGITGLFYKARDAVKAWAEKNKDLADAIGEIWDSMKDLGKSLIAFANGDWEKSWELMKSAAEKTAEGIRSLGEWMWDKLPIPEETKNKIETTLGAIWDVVKKVFGWIIDNKELVIGAFTGIAAAIATIKVVQLIASFTSLLNPVNLVIAAFAAVGVAIAAMIKYWDKIKAWMNKIKEGFKKMWRNIIDGLTSWMPEFLKKWLGLGQDSGQQYAEGLNSAQAAAQQAGANLANAAADGVESAQERIENAAATFGNRFAGSLTEARSDVIAASDQLVSDVEGAFAELPSLGGDVGLSFGLELGDGLMAQEPLLAGTSLSLGSTISSSTLDGFMTEAPIVLQEIGEFSAKIPETIATEVAEGTETVSAAVDGLNAEVGEVGENAEEVTEDIDLLGDSTEELSEDMEETGEVVSDTAEEFAEAEEEVQTLAERIEELQQAMKDATAGSLEHADVIQEVQSEYEELVAARDLLIANGVEVDASLTNAIATLEELGASLEEVSELAEKLSSGLQSALEEATGAFLDMGKQNRDAFEEYTTGMQELEEVLHDSLTEANEQYNTSMDELEARLAEGTITQQEFADEVARIEAEKAEAVKQATEDHKEAIGEVEKRYEETKVTIGGIIQEMGANIIQHLKDMAAEFVATQLTAAVFGTETSGMFEGLASTAKTTTENIGGWLKNLGTAATDSEGVLAGVGQGIKGIFSNMGKDAWSMQGIVGVALSGAGAAFGLLGDDAKAGSKTIGLASSAIGTVISAMSGNVTGVVTGLIGVFSNLGGAWKELKAGAKKMFDSIQTSVSNAISRIKRGWNNFWSWLTGKKKKAEQDMKTSTDTSDSSDGSESTDTSETTEHATGFFANRRIRLGSAIVGEAGPEALLPLKPSVLREVGAGAIQAINNNSHQDMSISMEKMFDGAVFNVRSEQDIRAIARETLDLLNVRKRGRGDVSWAT